MRIALLSLALLLGGCVIQAPPREAPPEYSQAPAQGGPAEQAEQPVTSVEAEPPMYQPAPIAIGWAPPPMLVEVPPPEPFFGGVWVGGYWVWQGNWVWAYGHWMAPPRPAYVWVHPYYEHRGETVIFINGHWSPPGVVFVPPPPGLRLVVESPAFGVIAGPRPLGPQGCFVPAPPGSRRGIIIPAPVGTAPAVVTGAPPVVAVGMRVTNNVTQINNTNITHVTNITNVTIVAPAAATANGHAFNTSVPAAPHLAAARPAFVPAHAPPPNFNHPAASYTAPQPPARVTGPPGEPVHQPVAAREPMAAHEPPPHPGYMQGNSRPTPAPAPVALNTPAAHPQVPGVEPPAHPAHPAHPAPTNGGARPVNPTTPHPQSAPATSASAPAVKPKKPDAPHLHDGQKRETEGQSER